MGILKRNKDKDAPSYQEMVQAGYDPRKAGSLTKKEAEAIKAKAGKPSTKGDISAGVSDFLNGVKSNRAVGPAPKPRKGRSMW